jgi:hypothetical protein
MRRYFTTGSAEEEGQPGNIPVCPQRAYEIQKIDISFRHIIT